MQRESMSRRKRPSSADDDRDKNPADRRPRAAELSRWKIAAIAAGVLGIGGLGGLGGGCGSEAGGDGHGGSGGKSHEALGQAAQALTAAPVHIIIQQGVSGAAQDVLIANKLPVQNFSTSPTLVTGYVGGPIGNGGTDRDTLLRFDLSQIPSGATITSAVVTLNENGSPTGPSQLEAHRILLPWNQQTVTWQNFYAQGGVNVAYNAQVEATAANMLLNQYFPMPVHFSLVPLVQNWVSGVLPNNGLLVLQPNPPPGLSNSPPFTVFSSSRATLASARPSLDVWYFVTCPAGFADCNNNGLDGCEADLSTISNCGACGNLCASAFANAAPACVGFACAMSCNAGFGDCDNNQANGCETTLSTAADCGACGVACALANASSSCANGTCQLVSCNAGSFDCDGNPANGCESLPCANGQHCSQPSDCSGGICQAGFCATPLCNDGVKNGTETAVDCGGPTCPACAIGLGCAAGADCQSGVCQGGVCLAPACNDSVKNGAETGVDCGGATCAACAAGLGCAAGADCQSGVCQGGVCLAPVCNDGVKNGAETGVDCGGTCSPCAAGIGCLVGTDCVTLVCASNVCQMASCADTVKNGSETGVDCGGSCAPCGVSLPCITSADCASGVCKLGFCQAPSCSDGVKNGTETGVDCGGACFVPEKCDGIDNDCNGLIDDGLGNTTCGIGACQVTVPACANGAPTVCVPGTPTAEICDGLLDDDCDGVVDNGCACINGKTQSCYSGSAVTRGVGACHGGTQTCVMGQWAACVGEVLPTAETCDDIDNDCDGQVDDGLGTITCGSGTCQGTAPVCVNGAPGTCTPKANGTACNDGSACTQTDTCQSGVCVGGAPVVCGAPDQCHTAGSCDPVTGTCSNPAKPNGAACNDGTACTQADTCQSGVCVGGTPVVCGAPDQCHTAGSCDPVTGTCSNPAAPDGTSCDDGNPCTQTDTCHSGVCGGSNPVVCSASDQCHVAGSCNPATGVCSNPAKADGATCNDGNACTQTDTCQAGACAGSNPVVCGAPDQCHLGGACSPATGVCSNPVKANGTACDDGHGCTQGDSCQAGACVGTITAAGTVCRPSTGACDPAEACDGISNTCPVDSLSPVNTVCRLSNGLCDVAEKCTGSTPACPPDGYVASGTPCNDGDGCTTGDVCTNGVCAGSNQTGAVCTYGACASSYACVNNALSCQAIVCCPQGYGCDGICGSGKVVVCGTCGGTTDCAGGCTGKVVDSCGVCGGNNACQPPTCSLSISPSSGGPSDTFTATYASSGVTVSFQYSLDGAAYQPAPLNGAFQFLGSDYSPGAHTFNVKVTNPYGTATCSTGFSNSVSMVVPPTCTITATPTTGSTTTTFTATWSSSPDATSGAFYLDGKPYPGGGSCAVPGNCIGSYKFLGSVAGPGLHLVKFQPTGPGGTGSCSVSIFVGASSPPTCSGSVSPLSGDTNTPYKVTWSSSADASTCTYSEDGVLKGATNCAGVTTLTGAFLGIGTHTITLSPTGPGGTGSCSTNVFSVTPPPPPPTCSGSMTPTSGYTTDQYTANWSSSADASACTYSVDSVSMGAVNCAGIATFTGASLGIGYHTMTLNPTGPGGTGSCSTNLFRVIGPPVCWVSASSGSISWSSTDATSCTYNNASYPCSGSLAGPIPSGTYCLNATNPSGSTICCGTVP